MNRRGQAVTELALGLLVLVPTLLGAIYLAEAFIFRIEATEAASEPLWDATAEKQHEYEGAWVQTPGAIALAQGKVNGRMRARKLVLTEMSAPQVQCGPAAPMAYVVGGVPYQDSGGISCNSRVRVDAYGLSRGFIDSSPSGFFQEPLANWKRNFDFCGTRKCRAFQMAIGDWGLAKQGAEMNECTLTMDSCENNGFFAKAKATFDMKPDQRGTKAEWHRYFMESLIDKAPIPDQYPRVTDFQMSFQGETNFMEDVPVIEGDREWRTTPFLLSRLDSYNARSDGFLGL